MFMRAAVLKEPGLLCIEDVPLPACPAGGILLRVGACGLCASDLKMWRLGHKELKLPRILGHEVVGVVEESDSAAMPVGTTVQVAPGMPCGACPACWRGAHNRCPQIAVLGFSLDGGLAEFMAVPAQGVTQGAVIPLPAGLDPATDTLAEPLACVLNAWQQARLTAGESVAIIGAGALGRLAAWSAKALGARAVVLIEKEAGRFSGLGDSGITPLAAGDPELAREVLDGGADVVLPACPDPLALSQGLDLLNQGGRLVLFSGLKAAASLDLNQVHYRELTLVGAYGCTAGQNRCASELLASGAIPVETIISHRLPLAGVLHGLELMERGAALKVVIHPQKE
jgi:L-iditol 2-dehydrogenase